MSAEKFAEFLRRKGHRVIRTDTTWWFHSGSGLMSHFPFNSCIEPDQRKLDRVMGLRAVAARYSCPAAHGPRCDWYIINRPDYDLDQLSSNTRSKIRRGLKRCDIRQLDFSELESLDALQISRETRQRRNLPVSEGNEADWRRVFTIAREIDTFETWGAFVNGELAAFLIACNIEGCAQVSVHRSRQSLFRNYPNNALIFRYTQDVLSRSDMREVSYGCESIQGGLAGLDAFKKSMGFIKRTAGQRIEFNRYLRPLARCSLLDLVRRLAQFRPRSARLGKVAGMIQCYQQQPARRSFGVRYRALRPRR